MKKIINYTLDGLKSLWKRRLGYETGRTDCSITRIDGFDLDAALEEEIRFWYIDTLLSAPVNDLPLYDIATETVPVISPERDALRLRLPDNCLRLAEVSADFWSIPAEILPADDSPAARALANPFVRSGTSSPVVTLHNDSITVHSLPSGAKPEGLHILAVMYPDSPDIFPMTYPMLSLIPSAHVR